MSERSKRFGQDRGYPYGKGGEGGEEDTKKDRKEEGEAGFGGFKRGEKAFRLS